MGAIESHEFNNDATSISKSLRGGITENREKQKVSKRNSQINSLLTKNVESSTILNNIVSRRYKGKRNIRKYIMEMYNLVTKLRASKIELSDDILVHLVLISLPPQFSKFKVSYNTQKEK